MSRKVKPKEAVILLIDIGQNVGEENEEGDSFLQKSKQCASKVILRKIFSDASDEFGLILLGSEQTDNELDYPNIEVTNKWLTMPNWHMLKRVEDLSTTTEATADWLDALIVAINVLKSESDCKQFTKLKIIMMSNFVTPCKSKDQVDDVVDSLKQLQINLVVIGPKPEENENFGGTAKSKLQIKEEDVISKIINKVKGVICDFDEAMAQLDHFQGVMGKASAWNCDLQIGENIFIPITGFKKFASNPPLKWKKRTIDKMPIIQDAVYFQGDTQVEKGDLISSYLFGLTVVPFSGEDKTSMALTTEKSLQLIGFTKKENVPRHIFLGDSAHYIVPENENQAAMTAITALVKGLLELEMVAIVRKVYCKNGTPHIGALIPVCEQESYFLYFVQLPFAEDERSITLPSLKKIQPTQEQMDAVDSLIDNMDLSHYDEDEDPYSKLINISVEHTNNSIAFKARNPDCKLPDTPVESVINLIKPMPELIENASTTLNSIMNIFQLEEIEQKSYRKGAADIFDRSQSNGHERDVEDVKPQDLVQAVTSFGQSTVTEVGTVDPEANFLKLLQNGEPFNKLCDQMQSAIRNLFLISSSSIGVQKPLSALALLRKNCVIQDPIRYNCYIASLKDSFVERGSEQLWNSVAQDKLGLITKDENNDGQVTLEDAEIFYLLKKTEAQSRSDEYEMEAEDLLDML